MISLVSTCLTLNERPFFRGVSIQFLFNIQRIGISHAHSTSIENSSNTPENRSFHQKLVRSWRYISHFQKQTTPRPHSTDETSQYRRRCPGIFHRRLWRLWNKRSLNQCFPHFGQHLDRNVRESFSYRWIERFVRV